MLVVVGPNGSGKSSIIEGIFSRLPEDHPTKNLRMVNADIAEREISENACDSGLVVDNSKENAPYRPLLSIHDEKTKILKEAAHVKWLHTYYLDKQQ